MNPDLSLRVSVFSEQGGRKYMEDLTEVIVELEPSDDELRETGHADPKSDQEPDSDCINKPLPVTVTWRNTVDGAEEPRNEPAASGSRKSVGFFAVFDGHGGREAALFARDHLWDFLKKQRGFWSKDYRKVCTAIRKGFIACHHAMWKKLRKCFGFVRVNSALNGFSFQYSVCVHRQLSSFRQTFCTDSQGWPMFNGRDYVI